MIFLLSFRGASAKCTEIQITADLSPGFLGPALRAVITAATKDDAQFGVIFESIPKIISIVLSSKSSLSGNAIPLVDEDIVPHGYHITRPVLLIQCALAPVDAEFTGAFEKAAIAFRDSSVKPIIVCQYMKDDGPPESSSASGAKEQEPEKEQPPPKRLKVYFTSALADGFNEGDADYMQSLIDGLRALRVEATRLVGNWLTLGPEQQTRRQLGALVQLDYGKGKDNAERARAAILEHILSEKAPDLVQILNIQSRLPASGNAFTAGEHVNAFTAAGIHVLTTVHEWNYILPTGQFDRLAETLEVCRAADRALFLSDSDHQGAVSAADVGKIEFKGPPRQVERFPLGAKSTYIPIPVTTAFELLSNLFSHRRAQQRLGEALRTLQVHLQTRRQGYGRQRIAHDFADGERLHSLDHRGGSAPQGIRKREGRPGTCRVRTPRTFQDAVCAPLPKCGGDS